MREKLSSLLIIILVGFIGFIGFRSCISSTYSVGDIQGFTRFEPDGSETRMFLVPSNFIVVQNESPVNADFVRFVHSVWFCKGSSFSHFIGPFYSAGETVLDYKYLPNVEAAYNLDNQLIELKCLPFSEKLEMAPGDKMRSQLLIYPDRAVLGGIEYVRMQAIDFDSQTIKEYAEEAWKNYIE